MDSVFNDIEFLMGNIKQETTNSTERPVPLTEGVQSNETDQLAMSTYMTDFILDYINRSLKNEDDEETQPETSVTDRENDESVEELLERAENIIRENAQQCNQVNIPEASVSINEWMEPFDAPQGNIEDNPINSGQSTIPAPNSEHAAASRVPLLVGNEVSDVISVDTDSDDEVIFVNSHQTTAIPVIDLSDHSSSTDISIQPAPKRHESRKRTRDSFEIYCDSPAAPVAKPQEKQFRHSCAICLEDVKSPHSTTCGHIYCGDCIKNALKIFKKCPTCNKKLKTSNVHPIYL